MTDPGDTDADVIIVGAGPAGMSAALVLARACRRVLVFDHGRPRNAAAAHMHGYLTRDGVPPSEFLTIARAQLAAYPAVQFVEREVTAATCVDGLFRVTTAEGSYTATKLLLATGVVDHVPDIPGFRALYGTSVFHCPYCDGYEFRNQPMAVYGCEAGAYGLALNLLGWSSDVAIVSDGPCGIDPTELAHLAQRGIPVREEPIARLEGTDGQLERVVFTSGEPLERRTLFFTTGQTQCSPLAQSLGCEFNEKGTVRTGPYESTHLPGLYVAGDASRSVQWVIVAAAEGAEAAFAINEAFLKADA